MADLQRGAALSQAALTTCDSHHATLTVWRWEEGFDLSRRPAADLAADLITVRGLVQPAIALQMPGKTNLWHKGEVLVFELCRREDIQENDICLAQLKTGRSKGSRTIIALAHLNPAKRGKTLQLESISPSGPIVSAQGDSLIAVLRAVYRARHLKS